MTHSALLRPQQTSWWRIPFTAEPWRRTGYVLLAAPAAIRAVADGGRAQQRYARRLLGRDVPERRLRGLLGLPLDLLALVITGYGWMIAIANIGYPARWLVGMGGSLADAWGGPTLAGAWAFHLVVGGLPALFATPWLLRGLTHLQVRLLG
jgi:hypothetical protein